MIDLNVLKFGEPSEATLPASEKISVREALLWLAGFDLTKAGDLPSKLPNELIKKLSDRSLDSFRLWNPFVYQVSERLNGHSVDPGDDYSWLQPSDAFRSSKVSHELVNSPKRKTVLKRRAGQAVFAKWKLRDENGDLNESALETFQEVAERWRLTNAFYTNLAEKVQVANWVLEDSIADVLHTDASQLMQEAVALSFARDSLIYRPLQERTSVEEELFDKSPKNDDAVVFNVAPFCRERLLEHFILRPIRELDDWKNDVKHWKAWPLDWVFQFIDFRADWSRLKDAIVESARYPLPIYWTTYSVVASLSDNDSMMNIELVKAFVSACRQGKLKCQGYTQSGGFSRIRAAEWCQFKVYYNHSTRSAYLEAEKRFETTPRYTHVSVETESFLSWLEDSSFPEETLEERTLSEFTNKCKFVVQYDKKWIKKERIQWVASKLQLKPSPAEDKEKMWRLGLPKDVQTYLSKGGRPRNKKGGI